MCFCYGTNTMAQSNSNSETSSNEVSNQYFIPPHISHVIISSIYDSHGSEFLRENPKLIPSLFKPYKDHKLIVDSTTYYLITKDTFQIINMHPNELKVIKKLPPTLFGSYKARTDTIFNINYPHNRKYARYFKNDSKRSNQLSKISASILAKMAGRREDGTFDKEILMDLGNKFKRDQFFGENKDLHIDRAIEELVTGVMQNAYIILYEPYFIFNDDWQKVNGISKPTTNPVQFHTNLYKIDISREDLTQLAQKYWIDSLNYDQKKIQEFNELEIPVKHINYLGSYRFFSGASHKKITQKLNKIKGFGVTTQIKNSGITKNNEELRGMNHDEIINSLYRQSEALKLNKKSVNFHYVAEKVNGKDKIKAVVRIIKQDSTYKEFRQLGGKKLNQHMYFKESRKSGIYIQIGYDPQPTIASNGIQLSFGHGMEGFIRFFQYFKTGTKSKFLKHLKFNYNITRGKINGDLIYGNQTYWGLYYPNGFNALPVDTTYYIYFEKPNNQTCYSFTFSLKSESYLTKRGNLSIEPEFEIGWCGLPGLGKGAPDGGNLERAYSGVLFKFDFSANYYINHFTKLFIKPRINIRGPISVDPYTPKITKISENLSGWEYEFNNLHKTTILPSISFGLNFNL